MNIYFIIAGIIGLLGGLAHMTLGHRWTLGPLDPNHLASSQFSGEENQRYLTWFWHIGSAVLLSTTLVILLQGLNFINAHQHLLYYISFLWLSTTIVFLIVASRPPTQVLKMVPGLVGIPINMLILLGLFFV
ncbi:MAG: hypothetical protein AAF702_05935 [Chloroflexota bacterium]